MGRGGLEKQVYAARLPYRLLLGWKGWLSIVASAKRGIQPKYVPGTGIFYNSS